MLAVKISKKSTCKRSIYLALYNFLEKAEKTLQALPKKLEKLACPLKNSHVYLNSKFVTLF